MSIGWFERKCLASYFTVRRLQIGSSRKSITKLRRNFGKSIVRTSLNTSTSGLSDLSLSTCINCIPFSCSLSLSISQSLSLSLSLSHSFYQTLSYSMVLCVSLSFYLSETFSFAETLYMTLTLSYSLSRLLVLPLCLSLSLSMTLSLFFALSVAWQGNASCNKSISVRILFN